MKISDKIAVGTLLLALAVATVQLYFSTTSDLTSWRGGGFGMYSEPHPNTNRTVWLTGKREGKNVQLRLHPEDDRLACTFIANTRVRRDLDHVIGNASFHKRFPSGYSDSDIAGALQGFLNDHGLDDDVQQLFPNQELKVSVWEYRLTSDFQQLKNSCIDSLAVN